MICTKCETDNNNSAKFCRKCGFSIENYKMGSVDYYFHKQKNKCSTCGGLFPTKYVKFYENIGMILQRQYRRIEGNMCRECIDKYFWEYTMKTLILGWWGMISFCITPFYLLNNIGRYLLTLGLKKE